MTVLHKEPNYYAIWGWLLVLTIAELATTKLPIGRHYPASGRAVRRVYDDRGEHHRRDP